MSEVFASSALFPAKLIKFQLKRRQNNLYNKLDKVAMVGPYSGTQVMPLKLSHKTGICGL